MEQIIGRAARALSDEAFLNLCEGYDGTIIDLGTGDGRFIRDLARHDPSCLAVGIDAARAPLRKASQRTPANALYLIANVGTLPKVLDGTASGVTVYFPYGSLLGLFCGGPFGLDAIVTLLRPGATLEVIVNAGALEARGVAFEQGVAKFPDVFDCSGLSNVEVALLDADSLRRSPTTWGRRLAFGRDPRAARISARKESCRAPHQTLCV